MSRSIAFAAAAALSLTACTDADLPQAPPTAEERPELAVGYDLVTGQELDETELALAALRSPEPAGPLLGTPAPLTTEESKGTVSQVIWGADTRTRVTPVDGFPELARVSLNVDWQLPGASNSGCTGAVIGGKYVLTAGHCVFQGLKGGWAAGITVSAGLDGSIPAILVGNATTMRTVTGWTNGEDNDYDYALITLDRNFGSTTGIYALAALTDTQLDTTNAYLYGYPCDKPANTMWGDDGPIETYDDTMVYYDIDTFGCQSGSAVYRWMNNQRFVFAVHTGTSYKGVTPYNRGTRINQARLNLIQSWMATGT